MVAEDKGPNKPVEDAYRGQDLTTVAPDIKIEETVELMRGKAIRRLPVVEGDRPVSAGCIGDLVLECDETSALADQRGRNLINSLAL